MPTQTYTADEVADRLGRHTESIRRNLRKGQLEGEKWSNKWVVTDEALQEWLPGPVYEDAFGTESTD